MVKNPANYGIMIRAIRGLFNLTENLKSNEKNYFINLGKTQGLLPKTEIIPGETIKMGSNIKCYISKVDINSKGALILLTRKYYGFVKRLFELEIPEISEGTVMIYSIAREAGVRSKVAVYSENPNVDAIGACIGERGSRIASILKGSL